MSADYYTTYGLHERVPRLFWKSDKLAKNVPNNEMLYCSVLREMLAKTHAESNGHVRGIHFSVPLF